MEIVFIIGSIVLVYFVITFFKNGAKRRAKIISNLILVAEVNGGQFTTDAVFYEAIEKFVLENGGTVVNTNSSYVVIGENQVTFYRGVDGTVDIRTENYEEAYQDLMDQIAGRGKYAPKKDINILLEDFNESLPIKINEQITLTQIFGNDELVWMIFQVPDRGTEEEDKKLFNFIQTEIKDTSFVKDIKHQGININIQILTENGKNVVTASLDEDILI